MFLQVTQYLPLYSMFSDADAKGFSDKKSLVKASLVGKYNNFSPTLKTGVRPMVLSDALQVDRQRRGI